MDPEKTGNVDNPTKNGIYCMNIGRLLESNGELSSEWKVQRWYCIESSKRAKNRHQFYFDEKKVSWFGCMAAIYLAEDNEN